MNQALRARGRRLRRRLLFCAVLGVLVYGALELLSFTAYWAMRGQPWSPSFTREAQAQIARAVGPGAAAPTLAMQDSGGDMCIHPYLGFVANRDTDDQMFLPPWGAEITPWGFADSAGIVRKKRPDTLLVGIFGGSVAEFFGTDGAAELERQLRAHPAYAARRIEFVRMGLGGFKQPQQLFALTWLLAMGGELDLAIALDGFNDVTLGQLENEPRGVPHFFPRNWALLAEHAPDPVQRRAMGTVTVLQDLRAWLAGTCAARPLRWSVTAGLVWELADQALARHQSAQLQALQAHARADAPFHITGPGVTPADGDDARADLAVDLWQRCARAMARVCQAHGIACFHFLQPNQYFPGSKVLTAEEQRQAFDAASPYRPWIERAYPRLRAAGARLAADGLAFTDLTQIYADTAATIYIDNCCHVNALGNEMLARALATAILARAPDAPPRAPFAGRALLCDPPALAFDRPFAAATVRVFAGADEVTCFATTYASDDPRVARVDGYGRVVAVRAGSTRITIRHGDAVLTTPVQVTLPAVLDLGGASAPAPYAPPRLTLVDATARVRRPGGQLPGALVCSPDPAPRAFCRGALVVPLQSPFAVPLAGGEGEVVVPLDLPPVFATGTIFVQALFKASDDPCGFAISNAVAWTR